MGDRSGKIAKTKAKIKKVKIIVDLIVWLALFVVMVGFFAGCLPGAEADRIVEEDLQYKNYLEDFLVGTGLTFVPAVKDGFTYYELRDDGDQLQGFVFLGKEEGWGGLIHLFVRTDQAGIIEQVYVWKHEETPIYVVGMDQFLETFAGHCVDAELGWQEDIHGLTGATVTAEAIIAAVHKPGITAYRKGILRQ